MTPIRCRHLRTKKLYTGTPPDEAFLEKDAEHATPTHFWCNLTQSPVGPDDKSVHPRDCTPGRPCCEQ